MKWILTSLLTLSFGMFAPASLADTSNLISGNALLTQETVTKLVKAVIVKSLGEDYDAKSHLYGLSLQASASEHTLSIPEKPALKEILNVLGISNQLKVSLSPINTSLAFGPKSFRITTKKIATNQFKIYARWEISNLLAKVDTLKINVPKGAFDQSFDITSGPVKVILKPKMGPITANVTLGATLFSDGAKLTLDAFDTNLDDSPSRLEIHLGQLQVNGAPMQLEIQSNGKSLLCDEPSIRAQFKSFEPQLMEKIQSELRLVIRQKFKEISADLINEEPFKLSFDSTKVLSNYQDLNPMIVQFFSGISADFIFSYVQNIPQQNLLTTQISSKVCIETGSYPHAPLTCLENQFGNSPISVEDTQVMAGKDAGVIINESWIQNIFNSDAFQRRVRQYYNQKLKSPGVYLGTNGVKVHFDPSRNSLAAVVNLKIDIKNTLNGSAFDSWSNFWDSCKKHMADIWENMAGSGQYVYLPVELTFKIKGIETDWLGQRFLVLNSEVPLYSDGTIRNSFGYYTNVSSMNATIRKQLVSTVKSEFSSSLPGTVKINISKPIEYEGVKFILDQAKITKNKGLILSGSVL